MNIGTSPQYPGFMVIKLDTIELCSEISGKMLPLTTLISILKKQSLWGVWLLVIDLFGGIHSDSIVISEYGQVPKKQPGFLVLHEYRCIAGP